MRFLRDHSVERRGEIRQNVQIDFAIERQHNETVFMRRWKAGRRGFFHSTLQSLRNHHPSVSIMLRHRKERIASAKVGVVRDSLTSSSSPLRGPDDIDFREHVYGSPARAAAHMMP